MINCSQAQSFTPNPDHILEKADSSIRSIHSISYSAENYTVGTLKLGEIVALIPAVSGKVKIEKIAAEDSIGARIDIEALQYSTQEKGSDARMHITYDGKTIRKLDGRREVVYVNEPDQVGKSLLGDVESLIVWPIVAEDELDTYFTADSIDYAGTAVVEGVSSHIIYAMNETETQMTEVWWFLGMEDYLPRKIMWQYSGIPGQERIEVTTLKNVQKNLSFEDKSFVLESPRDYEVKVFEGMRVESTPALAEGISAPNWNLANLEGVQFSLSDQKGKVVIMDFWATWCGPCIEAMPKLQELYERYHDRGLAVFGISTWEAGDPAQFINEKGYTYNFLVEGDTVAKEYNVKGLPTLYVIGPDGKILMGEVGSGEDHYDKLVKLIEENLTY